MQKLSVVVAFALTVNVWAAKEKSWKVTPHLYSRGGITLNDGLSKKANGVSDFNLGWYGDESNAIRNPLTEITMEAKYSDFVKYVYGVDVESNSRYTDGSKVPLNERLNYIEFYKVGDGKGSIWFGNRAYRGDGDYLSQKFPLDEHNMFGGGFRYEKLGPLNIEFAYGTKDEQAPYMRKMFINKVELPLSNGKLKSNVEYHDIRKLNGVKDKFYMIGGEFQRWGDKVFGADLYNVVFLNYAKGSTDNLMSNVFGSKGSKLLAQWTNEFKASSWAFTSTWRYQKHSGEGSNDKWSYMDVFARPLYLVTDSFQMGFDGAFRFVFDEHPTKASGTDQAQRIALMLSYTFRKKPFGMPSIRLFAGRMSAKVPRSYFSDEAARKSDNFFRFDYEIAF